MLRIAIGIASALSLVWIVACDDGGPKAKPDAGPDAATDADSDTDTDSDSDADPGQFTIMMYQDADNNLEDVLLQDVNEAERADIPTEGVYLIALVDRAVGYTTTDGDWTGAKLFRLEHDEDMSAINSPRLADPDFLELTDDSENGEELDMGSPDTLSAFIDFCKTNYPAENYILHLSDHGDGWAKDGPESTPAGSPLFKGTCSDDSSGNSLSVSEDLPAALEGKGIHAITFDVCLLGTVEVAWALKDHADYMGASVMSIPGPGWSYTEALNSWFEERTVENWVVSAVDEFMQAYPTQGSVGYSAVDLAAMDDFAEPLDAFVTAALECDPAAIKAIKDAAFKPQPFGWDGMMDFRDFVDQCAVEVGADLSEALLQAFDAMMLASQYSSNLEGVGGLSIYAPTDWGWWGGYDDLYDSTPFAQDTQWEDLIIDLQ
jgi:hypothetical protein